MIILGIESTAHTLGVAIIKDENVLANEKAVFSTKEGGMIPSKVADHHVQKSYEVLKKALEKSKVKSIDAVAFSQGPGIGHSLRIGATIARTIAKELNKPLIGVNHCIAHLEIGRVLTKANDPVLLYASGANTQIIAYEGKKYRVFGETLDMGVGNFIDTIGRMLKIGFPAGPKIEELAKKGNKLINIPYSVKGMDVSFGGILTYISQKLLGKEKPEDIAYTIQETIFAMLIEVAERAMAHTNKKELLLGGGVACNSRLQEMARIMCEERNAKVYIPKKEYLVDNAAMIAIQGLQKLKSKDIIKIRDSKIKPYERTDEVRVTWR